MPPFTDRKIEWAPYSESLPSLAIAYSGPQEESSPISVCASCCCWVCLRCRCHLNSALGYRDSTSLVGCLSGRPLALHSCHWRRARALAQRWSDSGSGSSQRHGARSRCHLVAWGLSSVAGAHLWFFAFPIQVLNLSCCRIFTHSGQPSYSVLKSLFFTNSLIGEWSCCCWVFLNV